MILSVSEEVDAASSRALVVPGAGLAGRASAAAEAGHAGQVERPDVELLVGTHQRALDDSETLALAVGGDAGVWVASLTWFPRRIGGS